MEEKRRELASLREQWESEKLGMTGIQNVRQELAKVELEFDKLDSEIKTKQSSGRPVSEDDYRKLYELDTAKKKLQQQIEAAEARESEAGDGSEEAPRNACSANR